MQKSTVTKRKLEAPFKHHLKVSHSGSDEVENSQVVAFKKIPNKIPLNSEILIMAPILIIPNSKIRSIFMNSVTQYLSYVHNWNYLRQLNPRSKYWNISVQLKIYIFTLHKEYFSSFLPLVFWCAALCNLLRLPCYP